MTISSPLPPPGNDADGTPSLIRAVIDTDGEPGCPLHEGALVEGSGARLTCDEGHELLPPDVTPAGYARS